MPLAFDIWLRHAICVAYARREGIKEEKMIKFRDYAPSDAPIVESFFDDEALKQTGIDDFGEYYDYFLKEYEYAENEEVLFKIIMIDSKPVGIIVLNDYQDMVTVMEFAIAPNMRGKGIGSSVLKELIANGKQYIGHVINYAKAVIFPKNIASIRAFEKAGFVYTSTHPDGDAAYYEYKYYYH